VARVGGAGGRQDHRPRPEARELRRPRLSRSLDRCDAPHGVARRVSVASRHGHP
jgi:hypothetical protein